MTQQEKNRNIINRAESVESYSEALEVVNTCEQLGDAEINDFLFEYVRIGTKNQHLEAAIEDRLFFDEEWLFKVVQYRNIFKIVHEFGLQAVANVESRELVEKAEAHKETGNIEEAKKCLKEALLLRPGDTEIDELLLLLIIVGFDDMPQKPKLIGGGKIVIPIMKPTGITVEYPGDEVWRYNPQGKEIFTSLTATSALQDKPKQSVPAIFETNSLIIEIHKGEAAGKLVIRLKK